MSSIAAAGVVGGKNASYCYDILGNLLAGDVTRDPTRASARRCK